MLGLSSLTLTSCGDAMDEITSLVLDRVLSPTELKAKIKNDVNVELSWTAMQGAKSSNE